ncbi:hypothetical protein SESBI_04062 [Sesbania bispinosa]|nr:hypothetical protein SESBI_04062 [Sesbania bispinosa]
MKNDYRVAARKETRTSSPNESSHFIPMEKQTQGIRATEEWTDEKHSMYIKSIEASFVNQLYDSKQGRASFSSKGTSYDPATTSGQFKVHRSGGWQKINFQSENPQTSRSSRCVDLKANPWIQHYRSSSKQRSVVSPMSLDLGHRKGIPCGSRQFHLCDQSHLCHQDMLCNDTEVSDQNFDDDEEVKDEKENNVGNVKRQKSLIIDARGNDQMVPIRKSSIGDVTKNSVSAA